MEIKLFAGFDLEIDQLAPIPAITNGPSLGLRATTDLWLEPTPDWMLASSVSATTINSAYRAPIAAGWRLPERFWVGPEIATSNEHFSRQIRTGADLTGLRFDAFEWSIAAGYFNDSFHRKGVDTRLGFSTRQ